VTAVASGTDHVLALTAGGDVYSWGCGEKGRLGRLPEADADNTNKRDEVGTARDRPRVPWCVETKGRT
jgi:alpha-tubulin suppressor-like RCC1 family protein